MAYTPRSWNVHSGGGRILQFDIVGLLDKLFLFVVVLGPLIAVHEFGHFIVAKKSGVLVERFSLGFGPPLWRKLWRGTEYRLALIPLGGYVKMYGEQADEDIVDRQGSFVHQSVWKRIPIVAAGPGFNFLLAIALIAFIHMIGVPVEKSVRLGKVLENSAAAHAGLQADDVVVSLDGQRIERIDDLKAKIVGSAGRELQLQVERSGQTVTLPLTPRREGVSQEWRIGVELRPGELSLQRTDPFAALVQGCVWTWRITTLTVGGFGKILSGAIPVSESLAGPLGIAREIGRQAEHGWRNVVFFAAGISVSLGILNLFPIPVLDGGHLLFFALEIIKGKPLSIRAREVAQQAGLLVLVGLMILAFYNDIVRMFFPS